MPAILMPGRRHKKLNLLIQFCNSNFHKIIFWNISKQTGFKLAFKISYLATFFSILSYHSPPRPTRAKALPPPPPPPNPSLGLHNGPPAKITVPSNPHFQCKIKFVIIFYEI